MNARLKTIKDKESGEVIDAKYVFGFAKHMRYALPNASFIGFTGTQIDKEDKDTRGVFGDYVSITASMRWSSNHQLPITSSDSKSKRVKPASSASST